MLFIMLLIMNQLELKLQSKIVSFKLMLLHFQHGILTIMELTLVKILFIQEKRTNRLRLMFLKNLKELLRELKKDKKIELSILKLMINSTNKDYQLVSVQDQVKQEELTDIFQKENNSNSILRKLTLERNDDLNIFVIIIT